MKVLTKFLVATSFFLVLSGFQILKTSLNVTVLNELGNPVEGATVQLFEKEADYKEEKNVSLEGVTDKKGIIKFKEIKAMSYYVIVRKDDKDNSEGGEQTGRLEPGRINKVNIIIQ
jgi:hypothetical protein